MATLTEARMRPVEESQMMKIRRIFTDHLVSATELNRRGGAVLDMALRGPVTITRKDEHFALLRRDIVAHMSAVSDQVILFTDVMQAIHTARATDAMPDNHPYRWLNAFEVEDLQDMEDELLASLAKVVSEIDLEAVETSVYEWHASAVAISSGVLDDAFDPDSASDPVPLTSPEEIEIDA